jgi:transposase-like protein
MEHGHSWKYAGHVLSAMQARIEAQKKAAREVEIFRRWIEGGEKKAALAREFGLSRSTVERICRRLLENGDGLQKIYSGVRAAKHKAKLKTQPRPRKEETCIIS